MTIATSLEPAVADLSRRHFVNFSVPRQLWEGVGCAVLAGAVTGYALGTNLWFYLATAAIASIAGIPAATQHRTLGGALIRTAGGGMLWAIAVLAVYLIRGIDPVMPLPHPLGLYVASTTLPAMVVGWIVWSWSNRKSHN